MDTARQEAQSIIAETQAELNQILGQARRQGQAELEVDVKTYRQELALRQAKLESQQKEKPKPAGPANLKQGEEVRIKSLRQTGFVLEPPTAGGEVQVQAGIMKISVAAADLERISGQPASTPARGKGSVSRAHLAKSSSIRSEIDLRGGKTVEEGVALVDKYLDDAFIFAGPGAHHSWQGHRRIRGGGNSKVLGFPSPCAGDTFWRT